MSLKIARTAAVLTTLAAVGAMSVATTPASAITITAPFNNWIVSGSLTPKKLNEPVTLPEGSTFNGTGRIELEFTTTGYSISGVVTGNIFVPPFSATVNLLGIPTTVGLTFTQVGPAEGSIAAAPTADCSGEGAGVCVTLTVPTKANLGITEAGTLGVELPTTCETSKPVAFSLSTTLSLLQLVVTGPHFTGTATIPPITCTGPDLALGPVLTAVMSGPDNAYAISLTHPPTK
jgi:hypothetical protein